MPRRSILSAAERDSLLALPDTQGEWKHADSEWLSSLVEPGPCVTCRAFRAFV